MTAFIMLCHYVVRIPKPVFAVRFQGPKGSKPFSLIESLKDTHLWALYLDTTSYYSKYMASSIEAETQYFQT